MLSLRSPILGWRTAAMYLEDPGEMGYRSEAAAQSHSGYCIMGICQQLTGFLAAQLVVILQRGGAGDLPEHP